MVVANCQLPNPTHRRKHVLDLLVHSPQLPVEEFLVHDGQLCVCGNKHCGPIAGSDHYLVTATVGIDRPAECMLPTAWVWSTHADWKRDL